MSAVEIDPPSVSSAGELERVLSRLTQRVADLEEALGAEREQRRELEEQLQSLDAKYRLIVGDILELRDSIDELRRSPPSDEPAANALPIMRLTWAYRGSPDTLQANERRAAVVWSHFFDVCSKTPTKYVLDSAKVGTILTGDEGESPYRQTIRRVMELVSELGREYVELRTVNDRNALVIDRDSFDEYVEELSQEVESVGA
ncbi:MAG: hypothetical protein R3324_21240 [Halobacteriales archaeon]|nr:hypothetical protein [Halobacteriales archaeon]